MAKKKEAPEVVEEVIEQTVAEPTELEKAQAGIEGKTGTKITL